MCVRFGVVADDHGEARCPPALTHLQNGTQADLADHDAAMRAYVTVPNLAYRSLEANLIALAALSGVTITSFEQVAAPLFASQGLAQLAAALPLAIKNVAGPVGLGAMYTAAVTTYATTNLVAADVAAAAIQTQWRTAEPTTAAGGQRDPANQLALAADVGIQPGVAAMLWNASDSISFLSATGWGLCVPRAMPGGLCAAALVLPAALPHKQRRRRGLTCCTAPAPVR